MLTQTHDKNYKVTSALITVQFLFGINYITSKVIVGIFPPLVWASSRVIISTFFLFGIAKLAKGKSPELNRKFFLPLICFALLGVIINQSSFLIGLRFTTATNSAVLNTLIPVFTLFFVTLTGKETLTIRKAVGFVSALIGVMVIRKIENFTISDQTFVGDLLVILNCLSYGLFLTLSKKFMSQHDSLWTTAWMFAIGSIGLTTVSLPDWLHFQMPAISLNLLGAMLFSIFGSTLLAYFLNNWALSRARSSSVALFIYLQPIVASGLAWLFFDEPITARTVVSSLFIFCGMILASQIGITPTPQPAAVPQPTK